MFGLAPPPAIAIARPQAAAQRVEAVVVPAVLAVPTVPVDCEQTATRAGSLHRVRLLDVRRVPVLQPHVGGGLVEGEAVVGEGLAGVQARWYVLITMDRVFAVASPRTARLIEPFSSRLGPPSWMRSACWQKPLR